jgi:hypothetical protein
LVLAVVILLILWERDGTTLKRLSFPAGWLLFAGMTLLWPVAMLMRHGDKVISLWAMHVTERIGSRSGHGAFAGETWWEYVLNIVGEALPWAPFALISAWRSWTRAVGATCCEACKSSHQVGSQKYGDRLLCAWAIAPLVMVSLARARNAHYAIYALVPWSVWAALGLARIGMWQARRGWSLVQVRYVAGALFTGLALAYGLAYWTMGPWFDRRGAEWSFYETVGRFLAPQATLILLYDDWDRDAYPTPFGPVPHDLAVRLYYLNHPACWHFDVKNLAERKMGKCAMHSLANPQLPVMVIGRERDLPCLVRLGQVEVLSRSSATRWDRTYLLAQLEWSKATPILEEMR